MKKFKAVLSTFVFCYIFWIIYTGSYGAYQFKEYIFEEIIVGIIVCLVIALFTSKFLVREEPFWFFNFGRLRALITFIPFYLIELFKANWDVARRVLSPKLKIKPGIVKIETDLKSDYGLALLANCITLTPGTITMDIVEEDDKCYLYIHWIDVAEKDIKTTSEIIKGSFEPWIRRVFR
jgi:multicomponent Na+:H+ antiporter subunit E